MDTIKKLKLTALIGVPVLLVLVYIFREPILFIGSCMPPCGFYEMTGYHCPGCGNTRAVRALLHLHPILSLRNNPVILLLALTGLGFYIELAFNVFGKKVSFMPKKWIFWGVLLVLLMIFYVVRNFFPILAPIPQ